MKKFLYVIYILFAAVVIIVLGPLVVEYGLYGVIYLLSEEDEILKFGNTVQQEFFYEMTDSERQSYLLEHQESLKNTKIDDAYIMIKGRETAIVDGTEIYHDMARISISAYSFTPDEGKNYIIKSVSVVTPDGQVIYEKSDCDLLLEESSPVGDIYEKMIVLCVFSVDGDWYYKGNTLDLNVEIDTGEKTVNLTFDVEVGTRRYIPHSRI